MDPIQLETLKALIGADGLYPDQEGALNEQMAMAQALRAQPQEKHSTGIGAALGGAAQMLGAYKGTQDYRSAMAKRDALYKDKASKMRGILDMMASHGQQQAPYAIAAPRPGDPEYAQAPQQWTPPTFG